MEPIGEEIIRTEGYLGRIVHELVVEKELIRPAGSPPSGEVIAPRARVKNLRYRPQEGKMAIEGTLAMEICYLAGIEDQEGKRREYTLVWDGEEEGLSFQAELALPEAAPEAEVAVEPKIGRVSVTPTAGGFRCRAQVILVVTFLLPRETRVAPAEKWSLLSGVEIERTTIRLEEFAGKAGGREEIKTLLALPEDRPDLDRVLAANLRPVGLAAEAMKGRVMVNGRLEMGLVYVGRDEEGREKITASEWGTDGRVPLGFETFFTMAVPDGVRLVPRVMVEDYQIKIIGPREVELTVSLALEVKAYSVREIPLVTGIKPGPEEVADLRWSRLDGREVQGEKEKEIEFEMVLEIPPDKPGAGRLLLFDLCPEEIRAEAAEGRCLCEGRFSAEAFYLTATGEEEGSLSYADWSEEAGSFTEVFEFPEARPELETDLLWRWGRIRAELVDERSVKVTGRLWIKVVLFTQRSLPVVREAALVPLAPVAGRPSMLFYVVQGGESLWEVARRYNTTVEALVRVNGLTEGEEPAPGTKLLIPKSPVAV